MKKLKKYKDKIILGLIIALCAAIISYVTFRPKEVTVWEPAVGKVTFSESEGHGTGFLVGPMTVLTASHVAKNGIGKEANVNINGIDLKGKVVSVGLEGNDVAVITLDKPTTLFTPHKVKCETPSMGEELNIYGYPMDGPMVKVSGKLVSHEKYPRINWLMVQAPVIGGMSGGPVFNAAGEVVGLVTAIMIQPLGGMMFMPIPATTGLGFIVGGEDLCRITGRI